MPIIKFSAYLWSDGPSPAKEVTIPGPYATTDDMETANNRAGQHYFDANTIKAFRSRIYPQAFGGRFFIDSVQFKPTHGPARARQYKVWALMDDGHTSSVVIGDATEFSTLARAKGAIKRLLATAVECNHFPVGSPMSNSGELCAECESKRQQALAKL